MPPTSPSSGERKRIPCTRKRVALVLALCGGFGFTLQGCKKEPEVKPASAPLSAAASATSASPKPDSQSVSKTGIDSIGTFPIEGTGDPWTWPYYVPWEDTTLFSNPLPKDSIFPLMDALREHWEDWDTLWLREPESESTTKWFEENLDLRECGGNHSFMTLKNKPLDSMLLVPTPPKPGFTYRILGEGGKMLQSPLHFDSVRIKIKVIVDDDTIKTRMWRVSTSDSSYNRAIAARQGQALVIGLRHPTLNAAVRPVPVNDSLKRLILKTLVPDTSMFRLFERVDFHSLGETGSRKRCLVDFHSEKFIVDVVDGKCAVQFRVNRLVEAKFMYAFALTESPIGDVIVIRLYETLKAFVKRNGKWVALYLEYNDPYNWGC